MPHEREDELAGRAARGDAAAVDEIYRRHAGRLWREVIWPILRDDARAEDALCETFLAALEALPRFRSQPGGGLWAWLAQIARRKAFDELRSGKRDLRLGEQIFAARSEADAPADPQASALAREGTALSVERVAAVLATLHPRYALAVQLRLQESLSREECAARLEVKVATFDVLLHRAVRAFREAYLTRFGQPPEDEK